MNPKPPRIAIPVALVALAALAWFWSRDRPAGEVPAGPGSAARVEAERGDTRLELASEANRGVRVDARVPVRRDEPSPDPIAPSDLIATLQRIGELRARITKIERSGKRDVPPEVEVELRALLDPIVHRSETFARVLELLQSGELRTLTRSGEPTVSLSRAESGGVWAASWTFCAHNAPGELLRADARVDGRRTALEIFVALIFLRPLAGDELARHLLRATDAGGRPIFDERFRVDLQGFVRMHPNVAALRTLLLGLLERLSPLERLAALRDALEEGDPDRVRLEIASHLELGDVEHALNLAASCLQESRDIALRSQVAELVLARVPDPFRATEFYVDQIDELEIHPEAVWALGSRSDALPALEASYEELKAEGANPKARLGLVNAMFSASPDRMMDIARNDAADDVRALALARASLGEEGAPDAESVELLQDLSSRADIRSSTGIGLAAEALAQRSRRAGTPDDTFTNTLIDMARDPDATPDDRRRAVDRLKDLIPAESLQALLGEIDD